MERISFFAAVLALAVISSGCEKAWVYRKREAERTLAQARALMQQSEWNGAIRLLKKAANDNGWNADAWERLGRCYLETGRLEWAQDMFKKAIERDPGHAGAYLGMGLALWEKNWEVAYGYLVTAYKINPLAIRGVKSHPLQHALAVYFERRGWDDEGVDSRKMIADLFPDSPQHWCEWGDALTWSGRYDEAARAYDSAIAMKNKRDAGPAPYLGLARVYYERGLFADAVGMLELAGRLDHKNGWFYYYSGLISREQGDMENAQSQLSRAVYLLENVKPLLGLADLYETAGSTVSARDFLEMALERGKESALDQDEMAAYYEKKGDWEAAFRRAYRAVDLTPENWRYHRRLSQIEDARGNRDAAGRQSLLAAQLAPFKEARDSSPAGPLP